MNNECCICYNPEIDSLIYGIKNTMDKLSENITKALFHGYSCDKQAERKIKILEGYLSVLEDENESIILGGEPCLDCNQLQRLAEKVRMMTVSCDTNNRKDLIIDTTGVNRWVADNPYCVSREKWEKIAYSICKSFKLELKSVEDVCNITFEVVRNIIPCDIIIAISAYEQVCDLKLKVSRDEVQCKIDFDILATETNCNIDFKTYKKLIDCNLSFDIIKTIYENGCSVELNNGVVSLITPLSSYAIQDFDFKGVPDLSILKSLNVDTSKSKYLKDPQGFINKLKQDYTNGK